MVDNVTVSLDFCFVERRFLEELLVELERLDADELLISRLKMVIK